MKYSVCNRNLSQLSFLGLGSLKRLRLLQSSLANCLNVTDAGESQQVMHLIRAPQPLRLTMSILTDDPLAPLGPGGPCIEKKIQKRVGTFPSREVSLSLERDRAVLHKVGLFLKFTSFLFPLFTST